MLADHAYAGKRVALSGATGGIGRQVAARFAALGAELVLIDRDGEALESMARAFPGARILVCDQTDATQIAATCASAGVVDVLVNNAGIIIRKPLLEHTDADIDAILDTNLGGAVRMALGFARQMQVPAGGRGGVILNLATQHAFGGGAGRAIYATSKAGIVQFTKAAAVEFAPLGIRVVAIAPGPIANDMTASARTDAAYRAAVTDRMPIGRFLESDEVAAVIVSLCHDSMSAIVGATLLADGGGALS
jgi:2-deoxy-D-gluconate 3-dehydrogenase